MYVLIKYEKDTLYLYFFLNKGRHVNWPEMFLGALLF